MKTRRAWKIKRKYEITSIDKISIIKKIEVENLTYPKIWKTNKILNLNTAPPKFFWEIGVETINVKEAPKRIENILE